MITNSKQKGFIPVILIIVIAAIALGGGVWVYKKNQNKKAEQMMEKNEKGQIVPDKNSPVVFDLEAQNNSSQSGIVTFIPLAEKAESGKAAQLRVEIDIDQSDMAGITQPAHIHMGSCPNPGDVKYPLTNVVDGKSTTVLKVSIDKLISQLPLAVNIHKSAAEAKVYVSCGNIIGAEPLDGDANMMQKEAIMTKKPGLSVSPISGDEAGTIGPRFSGEILAGSAAAPLLDYNKADFDTALKSDKLVVLYFYANWCPICREEFPKMMEVFDELSSSAVVGFRVNYNDNETDTDEKALAKEHGVVYQHTKVFIKNGKKILKAPDSWDKDKYVNEINKNIGPIVSPKSTIKASTGDEPGTAR